ncbi:hypothetical protein EVAR_90598_1 [Eumeta japonica]|uniref:PiggyBac transposable element-derived protein domain-containing protein n=1 Tax=Eumeta variegata TaxID=151549 RepID=A0A4C1TGL0_EUMVA|nr:hypothetical protein EVAR_90598_1 [Eumeta japonica]
MVYLSSCDENGSINHETKKPHMIEFYNSTKGVDTFDQMCSVMSCSRKTNRWPLCVFYAMINISCINSYIIYCHTSVLGQKVMSRRDFMKKLHMQLAEPWLKIRLERTPHSWYERPSGVRIAAAAAAPWTIPFLVAAIPEVLECHRTVSGLKPLEVATGVDEEAVEEVEEFEVKVEAAVEAKAEDETAMKGLDLPGDHRELTDPLEPYDYEKTQDIRACVVYAPASPAVSVPSSAAFIELEGHGNVTTSSSIASPSFSFLMSRPLNDDKIAETLLFDGSDDDDNDEDDETRVPVMLPPFIRL